MYFNRSLLYVKYICKFEYHDRSYVIKRFLLNIVLLEVMQMSLIWTNEFENYINNMKILPDDNV